MSKASTKPKKSARPAKHKRATSRPFPYAKVAEMWAQEKTIPEIAKAIDRVGKGDNKFHALRIFLVEDAQGLQGCQGQHGEAPVPGQPQDREARHQSGQEGVGMRDELGKIFIKQSPLHRCLACEELFSPAGASEHARVPCLPQPDLWCPPIRCSAAGTA